MIGSAGVGVCAAHARPHCSPPPAGARGHHQTAVLEGPWPVPRQVEPDSSHLELEVWWGWGGPWDTSLRFGHQADTGEPGRCRVTDADPSELRNGSLAGRLLLFCGLTGEHSAQHSPRGCFSRELGAGICVQPGSHLTPTHTAGTPGLPWGSRQAFPNARRGRKGCGHPLLGVQGTTEDHPGPCGGQRREGQAPRRLQGPLKSSSPGAKPLLRAGLPAWPPVNGTSCGVLALTRFTELELETPESVPPQAAQLVRPRQDSDPVLP